VLEFVWVALLDAGQGGSRQRRLQPHYGRRILLGVRAVLTGKFEYFLQMLHIPVAGLLHLGIRFDVIVAVGKAQPPLREFGDFLLGIIGILR
jgi:hypothetical protein